MYIDYWTKQAWRKAKEHGQKVTQKAIKEKREQREEWRNQNSLEDVCRERKDILKQAWNDIMSVKFLYLFDYLKHPATGGFHTILSSDYDFCVKETNLGQYSSKCTFNQIQRDLVLSVPAGAQKPEIESFDGIPNIFLEKIRTVNGITVYKAIWLIAKRGFNYDVISGFIAYYMNYSYHADTFKKAIKGVLKKVKRNYIPEKITLDTEITSRLYAKITGACLDGIKDWIAKNEITVKKMTVKELLPILEKTNAWGLKRFKEMIT